MFQKILRYYKHKSNRYARGILYDNVFTTEKSSLIKLKLGENGVCYKTIETSKIVDESFFEHFEEITQLELSVIEFEEDRIKNEFLVIRWMENGVEIKKSLD